MFMTDRATVLLTDRAWPDDEIEREIVEAGGLRFVSGPPEPASASEIERLVRCHTPAAILTCWAPVTATAIASSADLTVIARMGVGLDNIDVDEATARGIAVTNVPDYCVAEVSDHAVALVLNWTRGIAALSQAVRGGQWQPESARLRRLASLTCGIVGYGRIGRETARKLGAFGPRILVTGPTRPAELHGAEFVSLAELLERADVVVLHAPLTPETRNLISRAELARMKPGGLLVNVGRGGLVDTAALIDAIDSGHLDAAALDVLDTEPDVPHGLRTAPSVTVTPHVAFSSDDSVAQLRRSAAQEVVRVLGGGDPLHPCNPLVRKTTKAKEA
ncbi:D-3-phosphoglycerate dehydrogenase [Prauserella muralis]|nr:D-3-phosphoglycerate dehydrogenase [Prauserella muralis]